MLPAVPDRLRTGLRKPLRPWGGKPRIPLRLVRKPRRFTARMPPAHPPRYERVFMSRRLPFTALSGALAAAFVTAGPAPASAARSPGATGVVTGVDGKLVAHAKVCVDRNGNARCDANEHAVFSGLDGTFKLPANGMIVAEVGKTAIWVDPSTHAKVPVARALVLRAPATDAG